MTFDFFTKHKYRFLTAGGITGSAVVFGLCGLYIFIGNTNNTERVLDNIGKEEPSILEPQLPDIEVKEEEPIELQEEKNEPIQEDPKPFSAPVEEVSIPSPDVGGSSGNNDGYKVRVIAENLPKDTITLQPLTFQYDSNAPEDSREEGVGKKWQGIISIDDTSGKWAQNEERMYLQYKDIDDKNISRYFGTYNFKEAYETIKEKKKTNQNLDGNTLRETCKYHYHRKDTTAADPLIQDMWKWCRDNSNDGDGIYVS